MIAEYIGQTQHIVGSEKDINEYLTSTTPIIGDICFSNENKEICYLFRYCANGFFVIELTKIYGGIMQRHYHA